MSPGRRALGIYGVIAAVSLAAPFVFDAYISQLTVLWVMVLFAITWDAMGGQMGYNSLGNIFFFGAGMYISAVVQIGLHYDVAAYTAAYGAIKVDFTPDQYFSGLALGTAVAAFGAVALAVVLSGVVFGLRGPYFAIGTLGIALAAGELVGAWDYVGAGSGISLPVFPGPPEDGERFFYFAFFVAAVLSFFFFRWLYLTRFGLAINAIRDDEEKAEAMGIRTRRYKTITWSLSAFFLGICGALYGNYNIFIEPLEVAFATVVFGIPMVVMSLLGGKGTLWGPVIGAVLYHVIKEATWTYLLGWQWVALGLLIVVTVVFFQQGIMGWAQDKWPALFGIEVEDSPAPVDAHALENAPGDAHQAEREMP
jgi:branched-chain amino acid transport system permease protein